jgi:hypothetical protein
MVWHLLSSATLILGSQFPFSNAYEWSRGCTSQDVFTLVSKKSYPARRNSDVFPLHREEEKEYAK